MSAKIFGMWKAWEKKLNGSGKRSWIPGPPKKTVLAGVDPRLKQVALDRLAILREYHLRLSKPGRHKTKTEVMRIFLHDLRSGIFWLDAIKYPIKHLSRSGLYAWIKLHRDRGLAGLVPRYNERYKRILSDEERPTFRPLKAPIEMKFPGTPKPKGKAIFVERVKRRWKIPPLECPICLSIFYSMSIPKGIKKKRQREMLKQRISHTWSPNLDVLNAFIIDCLTGIVFKGHRQIVEFYCKKDPTSWPQIRILVGTPRE